MSAAIFYVYILFRPWDGSPFYVGKGKNDRIRMHERKANKHYNERLANIIKKARKLGLEIPKIIIRSGLSEQDAFDTEMAFIGAIGRREDGGPLVNLTRGGEGVSNLSPSSRLKMSQARRQRIIKPETRAKLSAAGLGRKHSVESKAKIGAASRGKPRSAEVREKLKKANLGKKNGPPSAATRAKISAAKMGHDVSEETRNKLSIAKKGKRLSEETKAKLRIVVKKALSPPQIRAKMRAAAIAHWNDPIYRRRMMALRAMQGKRRRYRPAQLELNLHIPG